MALRYFLLRLIIRLLIKPFHDSVNAVPVCYAMLNIKCIVIFQTIAIITPDAAIAGELLFVNQLRKHLFAFASTFDFFKHCHTFTQSFHTQIETRLIRPYAF